ncbi:MAG: hypothetical protein QJR03_15115 [Sphaerobacter sp.]|nr:hypothetical protein [Sphaerobacter sp.]
MARIDKRVRLEPDTEPTRVVADVHRDTVPRLIERGGEVRAVVVAPADYAGLERAPRSRTYKDELLRLAGAWSDLDATQLLDYLNRARGTAPPSPAVDDADGHPSARD